ncbi:hypothetical protein ACIOD2_48705 [Amycolatopsis sp. NPDC088138]|uniref:hypothetical protein n=1 Tax=Amycolatopsis sp. NPDC088138 TaxID=3363938 RepID=UPI00381FAE76
MAFLRRPRPVAPPGTFDRIDDVRAAIRELHTRLSRPVIEAFGTWEPEPGGTVAAMTRHLGIGDTRVTVTFDALGGHVGEVELGPGPEYFVTLGVHDPRDVPAVLAHEVTHIFLHRNDIRFDGRARNEILTDTAALYLGLGRPMLAAYRVEVTQGRYTRRRTTFRVGYLSPPEMGYVLARRALEFGEAEPEFAGDAAGAYRLGRAQAVYET